MKSPSSITSISTWLKLSLALGATALCMFAQQEPVPFPRMNMDDTSAVLPKLISRVEPVCPAEFVARGVEEDVYVAFVVDKTGKPTNVRAFFSEHAQLEKSAEEAVKQWRFSPGGHGGRIYHTRMIVAVHISAPPPKA